MTGAVSGWRAGPGTMRKGIVLAGGTGSRLYPLTRGVSKQLLAVYDKPLVYYPLSTLMLAGIREVLIVSRPDETDRFRRLLGHGGDLGMTIDYAAQASPGGIPEAFVIGERFLADGPSALILGDNLFHGAELTGWLIGLSGRDDGATILTAPVRDPERYGVVSFDADGGVASIEEKPERPRSNQAITGLYFFDAEVVEIAKGLAPSARGETEITDVIRRYHAAGRLRVEPLSRGLAWLDTGTPDALLDASNYVATIERRQGMKVACLEEIAWRKGWIDADQVARIAASLGGVDYANYLRAILEI